jgi:hypothetical protein
MTAFWLFAAGAALFVIARIGQSSPNLALALLLACLFAPWLFRTVKWMLKLFFDGLLIGLGLRASGVLKQMRPSKSNQNPNEMFPHCQGVKSPRQHAPRCPRSRGRKLSEYFPWDDGLDHLGD